MSFVSVDSVGVGVGVAFSIMWNSGLCSIIRRPLVFYGEAEVSMVVLKRGCARAGAHILF